MGEYHIQYIIICKNTGIFLVKLNNNDVAQINYQHV